MEEIEITGTTADSVQKILSAGGIQALDYLKESFLIGAMEILHKARRQAGLTQTKLAEKLHTRQSAIARLEADMAGNISLRHYVEYAIACGLVPFDITATAIQELINFSLDNPQTEHTSINYYNWQLSHKDTPVTISFDKEIIGSVWGYSNSPTSISNPITATSRKFQVLSTSSLQVDRRAHLDEKAVAA